jgi:hypothetical protein
MPDLNFEIIGAEAPPYAAVPLLVFKLAISNWPPDEPIHSVMLQCQIQIESVKRPYSPTEKEKLRDLFGEPARWGQTLRNKLWTHAAVNVPAFTERKVIELSVPCTYDLNVVGTKYFYALEEGDIPLIFLFSGTIFYMAADGRIQVSQVSWSKEAVYRLPVSVWQQMIEAHYPNSAMLYLQRDVFERLYDYKRRHGLPTWEQAIERLLLEKM